MYNKLQVLSAQSANWLEKSCKSQACISRNEIHPFHLISVSEAQQLQKQ